MAGASGRRRKKKREPWHPALESPPSSSWRPVVNQRPLCVSALLLSVWYALITAAAGMGNFADALSLCLPPPCSRHAICSCIASLWEALSLISQTTTCNQRGRGAVYHHHLPTTPCISISLRWMLGEGGGTHTHTKNLDLTAYTLLFALCLGLAGLGMALAWRVPFACRTCTPAGE